MIRDNIAITGMFGDVPLTVAEQRDKWIRFYGKAGMGFQGVEVSADGLRARSVNGMHSFADWVVGRIMEYTRTFYRV